MRHEARHAVTWHHVTCSELRAPPPIPRAVCPEPSGEHNCVPHPTRLAAHTASARCCEPQLAMFSLSALDELDKQPGAPQADACAPCHRCAAARPCGSALSCVRKCTSLTPTPSRCSFRRGSCDAVQADSRTAKGECVGLSAPLRRAVAVTLTLTLVRCGSAFLFGVSSAKSRRRRSPWAETSRLSRTWGRSRRRRCSTEVRQNGRRRLHLLPRGSAPCRPQPLTPPPLPRACPPHRSVAAAAACGAAHRDGPPASARAGTALVVSPAAAAAVAGAAAGARGRIHAREVACAECQAGAVRPDRWRCRGVAPAGDAPHPGGAGSHRRARWDGTCCCGRSAAWRWRPC